MEKITVGVLTISDRCSEKKAIDESGPNLVRMIGQGVVKNGSVEKTDLVADCKEDIERKLAEWSNGGIHLILTTGGTGVSERDVTPEATSQACEKIIPGISWLMVKRCLEITPLAALTRAVAGVRGKSLIVNLPGSKKASQECLEAVAEVIPHAIATLAGRSEEVQRVHASLQQSKSLVRVGNAADRKRESPYPLISVEEAQEIIMDRVHIFRKEKVMWYEEAYGHVLAQDLVAHDDLPPFEASLRDGYAVLSSDETSERNVIGVSNAGGSSPYPKLLPGNCFRVSTGAAVPPGSDAVVQVEDTEISMKDDEKEESKITLKSFPRKGQFIRKRGSDFKMGQMLMRSGTYLDSAALGLAAAAGITSVRVYDKPRVAVISTGDELVNADEDLKPGKVRDSNRVALLTLLKEEGLPTEDLGIVPDHPDALRNALEKGFRAADIVVTTGSMSMGERDYLKEVLVADFNAEICFGRIRMKPGKPTSLALLVFERKPKLWFGLPGNPASAIVTSHLFVLPALRKICGCAKVFPISMNVSIESQLNLEDRPEYARGILKYDEKSNNWTATVLGDQRSSRVGSCVNADCLLELPAMGSTKPSNNLSFGVSSSEESERGSDPQHSRQLPKRSAQEELWGTSGKFGEKTALFGCGSQRPIQPPSTTAFGSQHPSQPPSTTAFGSQRPSQPPSTTAFGSQHPSQPLMTTALGSQHPSQPPSATAFGSQHEVNSSTKKPQPVLKYSVKAFLIGKILRA